MIEQQTVVLYICDDLDRDPVGPRVVEEFIERYAPEPDGSTVDGRPVLVARGNNDARLVLVRTGEVVSHDYAHYLPIFNAMFASADAALVVNWHAGANAPDRILTAHTNGDVNAGMWAPSDPRHMRNLLVALDAARVGEGLDDFSVQTEGTHWSGVTYGADPALVAQYGVPIYDIEIGSEDAAYANPAAVRAITTALEHVVDAGDADVISVLCGGGVHCETAFSAPVLNRGSGSHRIAVSHLLPNHWLVSGGYDSAEADAKLDACVASIIGGVDVVAFHEKLKGTYKDAFRRLAERLGVPVVKHKVLMRPEELT